MNIYFVQGILVKTDKQNKLFEEFYRKQKICEDHEFNTFLDVCKILILNEKNFKKSTF